MSRLYFELVNKIPELLYTILVIFQSENIRENPSLTLFWTERSSAEQIPGVENVLP